jgi:hypothetical protein
MRKQLTRPVDDTAMRNGDFSSYKVAAIGGCQTGGAAAILRQLLPGAHVQGFHVGVNPKIEPIEILESLSGFDLVLTQFVDAGDKGPLGYERVHEKARRLVRFPSIVFTGFQPDCTYVLRRDQSQIHHPTMVMNSALVAACFMLGMPEERVAQLFNAYVFAKIGYFDAYTQSRAALIDSYARAGFDLNLHWEGWLQGGPFMYTINHPAVRVIATIITIITASVGIIDPATPAPTASDYLATNLIWPVYPEIAERIGVLGSLSFSRSLHGLPPGAPREIDLPTFIEESYATYRAEGSTPFISGRVDHVRSVLESELT